jgi:large subunit ribosomal protein L4
MDSETKQTSTEPITVDVIDKGKKKVGTIDLSPDIFDAPVKAHLMHEVVVYQQARHRRGTADCKTRGQVTGSTTKPWRQKGSGRARAGTRKSPIWRSGGVIFGPHPRDFSFKIPKKVRKAALRGALTQKRVDEKLTVVDTLKIEEIKTKSMVSWLEGLELGKNVLVIIPDIDKTAEISARNIPKVKVLRSVGINVRDLLYHDRLVMTSEAVKKVQEALS